MKTNKTNTLSYIGLCLFLLLGTDLMFIVVDIVFHTTNLTTHKVYCVETDRGYAEMYQYLKFIGLILVLGLLTFKSKEKVFVGWMLLFAYFLVDDAFKFTGIKLAATFQLPSLLGLRPQDLGELLVFGSVGSLTLFMMLFVQFKSTHSTKVITADMLFYLMIFAFFGIFFDMIHVLIGNPNAAIAFGTIEDAGEMVAISLLFHFVLKTFLGAHMPETSILNKMAMLLRFKKLPETHYLNTSTEYDHQYQNQY